MRARCASIRARLEQCPQRNASACSVSVRSVSSIELLLDCSRESALQRPAHACKLRTGIAHCQVCLRLASALLMGLSRKGWLAGWAVPPRSLRGGMAVEQLAGEDTKSPGQPTCIAGDVHRLDAGDDLGRWPKRLEARHRPRSLLDRPVSSTVAPGRSCEFRAAQEADVAFDDPKTAKVRLPRPEGRIGLDPFLTPACGRSAEATRS